MTKAVFVFRSKTEVFEFADRLMAHGIPAGTVGTPKEAKIGCGLAVEIDKRFLYAAKNLALNGFDGFSGIFLVEKTQARTTTTRLY